MKWRALMGMVILLLAGFLLWSIFSPTEAPLGDTPAESQEPRGNWEEPVVQVVQKVGPATVKIETTRRSWWISSFSSSWSGGRALVQG